MSPREISIGFDRTTLFSLAASGFIAVAVVPACFDDVLRTLGLVYGRPSLSTNITIFLSVFLGPAFPCAVLWLRHPRGRITWDEEGITEWDGDEARVFIRWSNLRAARDLRVLQLSDAHSGAVITVWSETPVEPVTRRRHAVKDFGELVEEIQRRGIPLGKDADLSLVVDPDRPRGSYPWIGRIFGYCPLLAGMVFAGRGFWFGLPLLVMGLVGLAFRVYPSWHELRAVLARLAAARKGESELNPAKTAYRSPGLSARPARSAVDARLSLAIALEIFVRVGLGVAAIAATVLSMT